MHVRGKLCQLDEETVVDQWNIKRAVSLTIVLDYICDDAIFVKELVGDYC